MVAERREITDEGGGKKRREKKKQSTPGAGNREISSN